ncbi:MAG: sensor histidine kinase, partial [Zymomonas sp.]
MSVAAPPSYGKSLGRRRRGASEADLSKTLRAARARLAGRLTPGFDRELLQHHAQTLKPASVAMPLPILLTGFGLSVFIGAFGALVWGLVALAGYLVLYAITRRFARQSPESLDAVRWGRLLL